MRVEWNETHIALSRNGRALIEMAFAPRVEPLQHVFVNKNNMMGLLGLVGTRYQALRVYAGDRIRRIAELFTADEFDRHARRAHAAAPGEPFPGELARLAPEFVEPEGRLVLLIFWIFGF